MEHDEMDVSRWVDRRLSSLEPPANWSPDSATALAKLRRRGNTPRGHRWWLWATLSATAAAACAGFLLLNTPPACANPLGCSQPTPPAHSASAPPPETAPSPVVAAPVRPTVHAPKPSFKESGSPTAPVTCELYSDYECPLCAIFYLETVPRLVAGYVETGKVRLIHRDFPLAQHRYARLAARYANAAGQAGYYQAAATGLFRTQAIWSADGSVDAQVARVVPPADMEKVRAAVENDVALDNAVATDQALAHENRLDRTPTLICNRQVIPGNLSFGQIQADLDQLLAQK